MIKNVPLAALVFLSSCVNAAHKPQARLDRLNWGVQHGDAVMVRAELDAGADPCAADADGSHALLRLMYHPELADVLLDKAAEKSCPQALYFAAHHGRADLVKSMLERGADPKPLPGAFSPLIGAAAGIRNTDDPETPGQVESARLLLDKGADPNGRLANGYPPLFYAIKNGHSGVAKLLLDRGADPNARGYQDKPLLFSAAETGRRPEIARMLIERGADPEEAIAGWEQTAVYWQGRLAAPDAGVYEQNQLQYARNSTALIERLSAERRAAPVAASAAQTPAPVPVIRSDMDKPSYRRPENPDDFAVVVGVGKYSDLPEARFAERDAEAVKEHLLALGFSSRNVVLLSNDKASRSAIEKFVETWLPRNAGASSRVVFYFSGHGAPDPVSGKSYLVPWDGDPGFLENTAYPLSRLYEKLGALKVRSVVALLDACFSGAGGRSVLAKGARPLVARGDSAAPGGRLVVLAAASGGEIASTAEDQGHGLFTYYLLKGLSGEAKGAQGAVTARGLHSYLKPKVQDAARRQNRAQTPVLLGADADLELAR